MLGRFERPCPLMTAESILEDLAMVLGDVGDEVWRC